ncbi:hypothetical protein [uncultured Gammaproteobacteria bacterium]|nr:hypothetical protein [uncultured Gammaproteobacteria bacterium]
MNEIQTITNIRDVKNKIKEGIKTINTADYAGQKFGNEQEYTYEGLLGGVDSLLTDVTTLIKAPVQFLKLSTHQERLYIFDALNNIQIYLDDIQIYNNPRDLHQYLDKLRD